MTGAGGRRSLLSWSGTLGLAGVRQSPKGGPFLEGVDGCWLEGVFSRLSSRLSAEGGASKQVKGDDVHVKEERVADAADWGDGPK